MRLRAVVMMEVRTRMKDMDRQNRYMRLSCSSTAAVCNSTAAVRTTSACLSTGEESSSKTLTQYYRSPYQHSACLNTGRRIASA
eukprot:3758710-Rhodomonas_salina.1